MLSSPPISPSHSRPEREIFGVAFEIPIGGNERGIELLQDFFYIGILPTLFSSCFCSCLEMGENRSFSGPKKSPFSSVARVGNDGNEKAAQKWANRKKGM